MERDRRAERRLREDGSTDRSRRRRVTRWPAATHDTWSARPDLTDKIVAVINEAAGASKTFRGLVDRINGTDGSVYVEEGKCGPNIRACLLLTMSMMGPNRLLRILIDSQTRGPDLMASIGHELQHAVEVLSYHNIRSTTAMVFFYHRVGRKHDRGVFETNVAIKAGNTVRFEVDTAGRRTTRRSIVVRVVIPPWRA